MILILFFIENTSPPPPSWFTDDTQLCYRWRADTNSGQCGDGVNTELCAGVGTYTTNYRDDTDSRSGGCRMQWSIRYILAALTTMNHIAGSLSHGIISG